ncbi:hypothetical protein VU07_01105 [Desulfobulbus sp. F4]|nr:hypothetical protein [Desulfobulbus sp. F3]MCW5200404.1 hypothetical protein [Desulfobulbus sp. F4]
MKKLMRQKREPERIPIDGYTADIEDGYLCYAGSVANVSKDGFCLKELPNIFTVIGKTYLVSIIDEKTGGIRFILKASPRWQKRGKLLASTGFKIIEDCPGWMKFVRDEKQYLKNGGILRMCRRSYPPPEKKRPKNAS